MRVAALTGLAVTLAVVLACSTASGQASPPEPVGLDSPALARAYAEEAQSWLNDNRRDPRVSRVLLDLLVVAERYDARSTAARVRDWLVFYHTRSPQAVFVVKSMGSADSLAEYLQDRVGHPNLDDETVGLRLLEVVCIAAGTAFEQEAVFAQPYLLGAAALQLDRAEAVAPAGTHNTRAFKLIREAAANFAAPDVWRPAYAVVNDADAGPVERYVRLAELEAGGGLGAEPAGQLLLAASAAMSREQRGTAEVHRVKLRRAIRSRQWMFAARLARSLVDDTGDPTIALMRGYAQAAQGRMNDAAATLREIDAPEAATLLAAVEAYEQTRDVQDAAAVTILDSLASLGAFEVRGTYRFAGGPVEFYVAATGPRAVLQLRRGGELVAAVDVTGDAGRLWLAGGPTRSYSGGMPTPDFGVSSEGGPGGRSIGLSWNTANRQDGLAAEVRAVAAHPAFRRGVLDRVGLDNGLIPAPAGGAALRWLSLDRDANLVTYTASLDDQGRLTRIEVEGDVGVRDRLLRVDSIRYGPADAVALSPPAWPGGEAVEAVEAGEFDGAAIGEITLRLLAVVTGSAGDDGDGGAAD